MLRVTEEATRVRHGYVFWVANGAVRGGRYLPACEGLVGKWHQHGSIWERPYIWHENAPPNRRDWFGHEGRSPWHSSGQAANHISMA
jgi:hypothetical protein